MVASLRALAFGLMTLVLAWHGAGAPLEIGEECRCEEGDATSASAGHDDADGDDCAHGHGADDDCAGDDCAGDDCADGDGGESCPPGCDDCSCCGGMSMLVTLPPSLADAVAVVALAPLASMERDAPRGEASGVFRPPRA